ncbi:MAG: bifunctional heptose 7-phosphate kinase/heptose 1-phosphate adenyltransferase [Rhodospirillales bacterium RIFCSPLOWO2_12_FULL_58_28]|nr:MAG: bifunctional heptose 7-phosphate kinase/heptose 1-phosphate adenyltransferase [Rhodospirillales bacterium RIFCSPLOWO2_02_FULL_58_16]OHC77917.1 MAG: bifunctional heptose 7-phosphate kinase/heptose 1-phosphate adenyltransferase [Rhodospirillales bacterium RIFCSPLOWO2_12_FULL_58_28]
MTEVLVSLAEALTKARVLCVGDVILDHFHHGAVERISPEAPIPVLRLEREDTMLGGAGNVVRNLAALGAKARFITVVGADHEGEKIAGEIAKAGIVDVPLIDDERKTSVKTRYLAAGQQMLRADRETVAPLGAKVREKLIAAAVEAMSDCALVVLSDYGKGVLDDGVAAKIIAAARKAGKTVIVDPKGADYGRYKGADVITPNRRELGEATHLPVGGSDEVIKAARALINKHGFEAILVTLGRDGMALVAADGDNALLATEALEVFDVSGAGDTVAATLAAALGVGAGLSDAAALANTAAGIVVGKVGTAVVYPEDIISALHHHDLSGAEAKVMALKQALDRIGQWRRKGLKVGFTNGCFDLLHPGHISLLAQAREACDRLVVGLNSDSSVKRLGKGDDRPIQMETARATVMASLAAVDMVIIFGEDTPLKLIEAIRPDVLVKGSDYELDKVVGADLVQSYGGRVLLAELKPGHSTTGAIARMAK